MKFYSVLIDDIFEHETLDEALEEAEEAGEIIREGMDYFEADLVEFTHDLVISVSFIENLLDRLDDVAYEICDESCRTKGYSSVTKEAVYSLRKLIVKWADQHVILPNLYVSHPYSGITLTKKVTADDIKSYMSYKNQ